jgi:hypothetical protein
MKFMDEVTSWHEVHVSSYKRIVPVADSGCKGMV